LVALAACLCLWASAALATTYYVDSVGGNDGWNGTSPSTAWQNLTKVNATTFSAGDQILLKANSVWNGQQLYPKGSGASGSPIVIDSYETGNKPLISADGSYQAAIYLYNQAYWEINGLEATNYDAAGPGIRQGVLLLGEDYGAINHIHLTDLDVHDVNGSDTEGRDQGKCNAGILVDILGTTVDTYFNDVLIEGCYVHDLDRTGIKTWSDHGRWSSMENWVPHTDVVIRNNVIEDVGGDGIVPGHCDAPLVEYNVASYCNSRSDGPNIAIWPWDCDDAVVQYNEAYLTQDTQDGQGYDIDGLNRRAIMQYNYSHDNVGGFLLVIAVGGGGNAICEDPVVRYNISQNDHGAGSRGLLKVGGPVTNCMIYNNVMYGPPEAVRMLDSGSWKGGKPTNTQVNNNIFVCSPGSTWFAGVGEWFWNYNVFYGDGGSLPDDPNALTSDPLFVNPGSGGIGRDTCDGYKLQAGSPCRDSGMEIPNNGGLDYWGNTVPTSGVTDRGAHEYQGGPAPPVADFSGNPTSGPPPLTVYFTDLSTGSPTSWDWTFGDGGTDTVQHPIHDYTSVNTYTVSLTAYNAQGQNTETKVDYITVSDQSCHVGVIDMADGSPPSYRADATITVHDQDCQPLAGVTVDVTWSGCVSSTDSDVTDGNGQVTFTSPKNRQGGAFICTVDGLAKDGYPYQSSDNHETSDSITLP
jgi:PKD repeat protein